ncbi:MAG: ATP-dependent Clp protease ATP-binding subunit ClpX [Lentimonas sp.]|jgi:ATP-dependent Clp protease ATP-binding subunit ClpX
MSREEPPSPFEEIQKQLKELFKDSNVKVSAHSFSESDLFEQEMNEETAKKTDSPQNDPMDNLRHFNLKPREVRDYLDRFVIQQDEAKKVLSVAICDHYNHVRQSLSGKKGCASEYSKQNLLLLGPTGVGKTYLMKTAARLIGVPFIKADATKFSETGYVGSDADDLVRDLVKAADGNIELAEHGIIFVDEIDKIASSSGPGAGGRDVSGRGVQINLLKLMEETEVNLFSPTDMMAQMQAVMEVQRGGQPQRKSINTRNILFIVSGAFDKLAESIKKRVSANEMGFGAAAQAEDTDLSVYLQQAQTRDFIQYGFEPEFIGRVPVRVACSGLSKLDLACILKTSEGSVLKQYKDDFNGYGITFDISADAIDAIAEAASKEGTGARGLLTVLEQLFRDYKFELPSTAIHHFDVSTAMIAAPLNFLEALKAEHAHLQQDVWRADIRRFASSFGKLHGFTLEFKPLAEQALMAEVGVSGRSIQSLCDEKFKDFELGLQLIHRNTGQTVFKLGQLAIQNPDKELSQWVVRSVELAK